MLCGSIPSNEEQRSHARADYAGFKEVIAKGVGHFVTIIINDTTNTIADPQNIIASEVLIWLSLSGLAKHVTINNNILDIINNIPNISYLQPMRFFHMVLCKGSISGKQRITPDAARLVGFKHL